MEDSLEPPSLGSPDGTNDSKMVSGGNGLFLRPVEAGESGEGLPYAPDDWPNPGDKWVWKVIGTRKNQGGYWADRYLYPPEYLQIAKGFMSKPQVRAFLRQKFPDADIDGFFSSFQWKIPCEDQAAREAYQQRKKKRARRTEPSFDSREHPFDTREEQTKITEKSSVLGMEVLVDISSAIEAEAPANVIPESENMLDKCAATRESSHHIQIPEAIQQSLTTAASSLMTKLKSHPLEFLGEKMKYFNDHVEWFVNHNFRVEELERELNLRFKAFEEKGNRSREIDACLNRIEATMAKLEQEVVELHRQSDELRREHQHLFA